MVLEVIVPPQMVPVRPANHGSRGGGCTIEGQTIRFNPAPLITPGQSLSYRVRVRAKEAGEVQLRAKLTSQNVKQPLNAEEKTLILQQR